MDEKLVLLFNSWMIAKDKADSLKEALDDLDAPPNPDNIPAMRERLANLEQQTREFKEQFLAAGGVLPDWLEEDPGITHPQESNPSDQEQQLAALREQVDAALHGQYKHIVFP